MKNGIRAARTPSQRPPTLQTVQLLCFCIMGICDESPSQVFDHKSPISKEALPRLESLASLAHATQLYLPTLRTLPRKLDSLFTSGEFHLQPTGCMPRPVPRYTLSCTSKEGIDTRTHTPSRRPHPPEDISSSATSECRLKVKLPRGKQTVQLLSHHFFGLCVCFPPGDIRRGAAVQGEQVLCQDSPADFGPDSLQPTA